MKKTTLYHTHLALNAKMTPFGGFEMPVQYSGVKIEHLTVRESLGVFDVSHMGEFYVSGPNALDLLQYVCSNDISKLIVGKAQYNYFPNEQGGVVDDLIVYRLAEERYLLVINASNIEKDWNWIQKHNQNFNALVEDHSDATALLAIQGPKAIEAMQLLTDFPLESLPFYAHTTTSFAGCEQELLLQRVILEQAVLRSISRQGRQKKCGTLYSKQELLMELFLRDLRLEIHSEPKWAIVFTVMKSTIQLHPSLQDWAG